MTPELQHALALLAYVVCGGVVLAALIYGTIAVLAVTTMSRVRKGFDADTNAMRERPRRRLP